MGKKKRDINSELDVRGLIGSAEILIPYINNGRYDISEDQDFTNEEFWKAAYEKVPTKELVKLFKTVVKAGDVPWEDDETPFGLEIFTRITCDDIKLVKTFTDYLLETDLDHQVYQIDSLFEVAGAHGWCKETYSLMGKVMFQCAPIADAFPSSKLVEKLKSDENAFKEMRTALQAGKRQYVKDKGDESYAKEIYNEFVDRMKEAMAE